MPPPPPNRPDPSAFVDFARVVAYRVAETFGHRMRSQEAADIAGAAVLQLYEMAGRFDPGQHDTTDPDRLAAAFRGWAYRTIRTAAVREACRLHNGGTYHTRKAGRLVVRAFSEVRPDRAGSAGFDCDGGGWRDADALEVLADARPQSGAGDEPDDD